MIDELHPHILLVDDEPGILEVVREQLLEISIEVDGYKMKPTFTTARNGSIALQLLKEKRFDVVVSDIKMPSLNGLELVSQLRTIEPTTKVILLSGHADKAIAIHAIRLGVYDLLEKPWHSETLCQSVVKACELGYRRRLSEIDFERKMAKYAASLPPERYEQLRAALRGIMLNDKS